MLQEALQLLGRIGSRLGRNSAGSKCPAPAGERRRLHDGPAAIALDPAAGARPRRRPRSAARCDRPPGTRARRPRPVDPAARATGRPQPLREVRRSFAQARVAALEPLARVQLGDRRLIRSGRSRPQLPCAIVNPGADGPTGGRRCRCDTLGRWNALDLGRRAAATALAGPGRRLCGLERRRQRGHDGPRNRLRLARRRADRRARSGGVLRLPGHPAHDPDDRGADPASGLAREHDSAAIASPRPSAIWCCSGDRAEPALAHVRRGVLDAAERLGVEMVVTLGALLADVPHTRPVPITGLASDPELVERLGLSRSSYEGPTGIVGIVHDACRRRGITSASLWAAVPHYVAAVPNPKAALALLRRLEGFTGVAIEASELEDAMSASRPRSIAPSPRTRRSRSSFAASSSSQDDEPRVQRGRHAVGRRDRARLPALPAPARHRRQLGSRHRVHALPEVGRRDRPRRNGLRPVAVVGVEGEEEGPLAVGLIAADRVYPCLSPRRSASPRCQAPSRAAAVWSGLRGR